MSESRYADPRALRFAIADRLRPLAEELAVALHLTELEKEQNP